MKINYRVFKTLTEEPFLVQNIDGKEVGFYKMNDTKFLQENVSRGRFYLWSSDGNTYKLLVEEGFYNKVSYFFAEEINNVWLTFLREISEVNKKTSKMFLFGSLGFSTLLIVLAAILGQGKDTNYLQFAIIGALLVTMIANMIHANKVNKIQREKNLNAQNKIRELLTEKKFNQLIKDQEEYMKEYFKFDDEEFDEEFNLDEPNELLVDGLELDEVDEEIMTEDEVVEEVVLEVTKEVKKNKVDYNAMTVANLKELAKDRDLVGYSALRKAELVKLLEEDDK